jgi:hypothetical protein
LVFNYSKSFYYFNKLFDYFNDVDVYIDCLESYNFNDYFDVYCYDFVNISDLDVFLLITGSNENYTVSGYLLQLKFLILFFAFYMNKVNLLFY